MYIWNKQKLAEVSGTVVQDDDGTLLIILRDHGKATPMYTLGDLLNTPPNHLGPLSEERLLLELQARRAKPLSRDQVAKARADFKVSQKIAAEQS